MYKDNLTNNDELYALLDRLQNFCKPILDVLRDGQDNEALSNVDIESFKQYAIAITIDTIDQISVIQNLIEMQD